MSDLNDLKLYGRIVKDAVIKQKDEQQLAFFTIAVNETKKIQMEIIITKLIFFQFQLL